MSSSNLINLMTLIWNLPLNFDVAFCNWLEKFLPPTVIFAAPGRTGSCPSRVMSVARLFPEDDSHKPKKAKLSRSLVMGFLDEDKIGTIHAHDDALVIIL